MTKEEMEGFKRIRQISSGFWASRVLLTASNYRIFDQLEKPVPAKTVAKRLSLDLRATEIILDALAALGFVKKSKERYGNTKAASRFLVSGKPFFQGGILDHNESLWKRWSGLDSVLKTGRPVKGSRDHESFIRGMHSIASMVAPGVVSRIDLEGVTRVLDLGGGPGTYSIEFAKRRLDVTLCDRAETFIVSKEVVGSSRFSGHVSFLPADFMKDDIGNGYDIVFLSQIMHSFGKNENVFLMKKIRRALAPKGRVVVQEFILGDDHTSPVQGALFSVNMLVGTANGTAYSAKEIAHILKKAGFAGTKKTTLDQTVLVEARK